MHKEGLETYNDLIKYLFCFLVHLLDSIYKETETAIIGL